VMFCCMYLKFQSGNPGDPNVKSAVIQVLDHMRAGRPVEAFNPVMNGNVIAQWDIDITIVAVGVSLKGSAPKKNMAATMAYAKIVPIIDGWIKDFKKPGLLAVDDDVKPTTIANNRVLIPHPTEVATGDDILKVSVMVTPEVANTDQYIIDCIKGALSTRDTPMRTIDLLRMLQAQLVFLGKNTQDLNKFLYSKVPQAAVMVDNKNRWASWERY